MRREPKPYEIFTHFKGEKYQIITIATHSETGERYVVYQAMYGDFKSYVRPYDMFMSETDRSRYPNTLYKYRFFRDDEAEKVGKPESGESAAASAERVGKPESGGSAAASAERVGKPESGGSAAAPAEREVPVCDNEPTPPEWNIDPLVIEFLDADTYEERLNILAALYPRITDDMINTMAVAIDIEVDDGPIEKRCTELKSCMLTKVKYERRRQ